jgi:hypothetical protein
MKSFFSKCGNIDYKVAEMKTVIKFKITVAKIRNSDSTQLLNSVLVYWHQTWGMGSLYHEAA